MMSQSKRFALTTSALFLTLSLSACLKTRAQLREEGNDSGPSSPRSMTVQDVQPQGQYVIDEIKGEFTRLSGRVEDIERAQRESAAHGQTAAKDEVKKLEQRVVELEQAQASMLEAIKKLQEAPSPTADPSELIEKAKTQLGAGNFDGAVDTLSVAMKSAKGKKLEEATLLRAEAHYAAKEYKKAIVDYSKFPEKFTHSQHMPKALFQIGKSFEALGMKDDAKGFYQELVEKYPKSPEAKKARSKVK